MATTFPPTSDAWPSVSGSGSAAAHRDLQPGAPSATAWLLAATIRGYQRWISPYKGFVCAHRVLYRGESCSEFGRRVILERGAIGGARALQDRFRECRDAAALLRRQRRAARTAAGEFGDWNMVKGGGGPRIEETIHDEYERKRKRLDELPGSESRFSNCPEWCFCMGFGAECLGPFMCVPW